MVVYDTDRGRAATQGEPSVTKAGVATGAATRTGAREIHTPSSR